MTAPPARPFVARWPALRALGLWLAAMLVCAFVIARTPFTADLSAFLPAFPQASQRVLVEQIRQGAAARVLMVGIEGGDAAGRAQASRELAAALRADPAFSSVNNGERGDWAAVGEQMMRHRYLLSDAVTPERFSVEGLRLALQEGLSLLGTPAGVGFKEAWPRDPTGELPRIVEGLLPAQGPRMEDGVWVSREAQRALLVVSMKAGAADIDGQAAAIAALRRHFEPLAARAPAEKASQAEPLHLQLSGTGVFAIDARARIQGEAEFLGLAGLALMSGLMILAFGRLSAVGLAMLPVASALAAGTAAVGLVHGHVHGFTMGFGSTLIGEAVDYAIYYLIQARAVPGAGGSGAQRWLRTGWPTVRLGLLTSLCGFGALMVSGFPGLAQLGLFSIAGLLAAAATTRWVLTALAPEGTPGQGLRAGLGRVTASVLAVLARGRWLALGLTFMALAMLIFQPGSLWRGDLRSLSPVPQAAQDLDARLRADLGASDARTLVVATGATRELALQAAEAAGQRLDTLVEQGQIAGYDSPARILPSEATQLRRRAALPEPDVLGARLQAASKGLPFKPQALGPFIEDVAQARAAPPLRFEDIQGTPLAALADAMLLPREDGEWSAMIALQLPPEGSDSIDIPRLEAALQGLKGVDVVDLKASLDGLYARYLGEARWQSLLGGLAVLALLALSLRDLRRWLAVTLPLAMSVVLTLAWLSWRGEPLGILHLVGLLLVVAVGSNYALFFDHLRHGRGGADPDTLASLALANLTTVLSFGLIARSDIAALSAIGVVVAPGALLALVLAAATAGPRPPSATGSVPV